MNKPIILIFSFIFITSILVADNDNYYYAKYLDFYNQIAKESHKKHLKDFPDKEDKPHMQVEATIFKGRTVVQYKNRIEDIDYRDKKIIELWTNYFKNESFTRLFKRKILVKEYNTEYWIIMQEKPIQDLLNDNYILLYYFYIGAYNDIPIFLSPGYED